MSDAQNDTTQTTVSRKLKTKYATEEELTQEYNKLMEYFDNRIVENKNSIQKLKKIYKNHKKLANSRSRKHKSSSKTDATTVATETATQVVA